MKLVSKNDIRKMNKKAKHQQDLIRLVEDQSIMCCLVGGFHGNAQHYTKIAVKIDKCSKSK